MTTNATTDATPSVTPPPAVTSARPRRLLVALAVVFVLVSVGIGGLNLAAGLLHSRSEHVSTFIPQSDRITVAVRAGSVVFSPSVDGNVHVTTSATFGGAPPQLDENATADGLVLDAQCADVPMVKCKVRYTIALPAAFAVQVRGGALDIYAADLTGPIRIDQDTGTITLNGVSGALDLHSNSGQVSGSNLLSPTVTTNTGSGNVTLDMAVVPTAVTVDGGTGDVSIAVPGEVGYQVSTSSGSGHTRVGVPRDPTSGHRIQAASLGGEIRITPHRRESRWSDGTGPLSPVGPIAPPGPIPPPGPR